MIVVAKYSQRELPHSTSDRRAGIHDVVGHDADAANYPDPQDPQVLSPPHEEISGLAVHGNCPSWQQEASRFQCSFYLRLGFILTFQDKPTEPK